MKHDIFDLDPRMTRAQRAWRIGLLIAALAVLILDIFVWRP